MTQFFKTVQIERKETGEYRRALIGECKGQIGEVVKYWNWGCVDLKFEDDSIVMFADSDTEEVTTDD